ncbi:MAG: energy-coupling factor ABC transporter ATP-binding protein [Arthrobacter sp.]|jgi:biotin transport system ATP-binding protein|nr:energy-coupling factor ABC transporter ATP-binding protein [Arthrobacter sp.]
MRPPWKTSPCEAPIELGEWQTDAAGAAWASLSEAGVELGGTTVLGRVTLALETRTVAVIGDNGSGKSTLARLLAGLTPATQGTCRVLGLDPHRDERTLRSRVAVVFSNPDAQIVMPTVAEDIDFSLRGLGLAKSQRQERVAAAMRRVGLTELAQRGCHGLSGGQKQLLALAGALVREPELIIADEPTAYLDARNARSVADRLLEDAGHRLVLVTHDLELAQRCDAALYVSEGRVVAQGEAHGVVQRYREDLAC